MYIIPQVWRQKFGAYVDPIGNFFSFLPRNFTRADYILRLQIDSTCILEFSKIAVNNARGLSFHLRAHNSDKGKV